MSLTLRAGFAVRVCCPANAVGATRLHPGYVLDARSRDFH
jgi:hypothetical protein